MPSVGGSILAPCRVGSGESGLCHVLRRRCKISFHDPTSPRLSETGPARSPRPETAPHPHVGRPSRVPGPFGDAQLASGLSSAPSPSKGMRTPACSDAEPELRAGWGSELQPSLPPHPSLGLAFLRDKRRPLTQGRDPGQGRGKGTDDYRGNRGWATISSRACPKQLSDHMNGRHSTVHRTAGLVGRLDSSPLEWTEMSMLRDGWKGWGHPPPTPDLSQLLLIPSCFNPCLPLGAHCPVTNREFRIRFRCQTPGWAVCPALLCPQLRVIKGASSSWARPDPQESCWVSATERRACG